MVEGVGDVNRAVAADGHARGPVETRAQRGAVEITARDLEARGQRLAAARYRRDAAVGCDLADALAAGVGDDDVAGALIHRDRNREHEFGLTARAVEVARDAVAGQRAHRRVGLHRGRKRGGRCDAGNGRLRSERRAENEAEGAHQRSFHGRVFSRYVEMMSAKNASPAGVKWKS